MGIAYLKIALLKELSDGQLKFYDWSLGCSGDESDKERIEKVENDSRFVSWYTDEEIKRMTESNLNF